MQDVAVAYEEEAPLPKNEIGARLMSLVREYNRTITESLKAEASLKRLLAAAVMLEEDLIPEAMEELGTEIYKSPEDGTTVEIEDKVFASISQANQEAALKWLEENGHGGIIKRKMTILYNSNQAQDIEDLEKTLCSKFPEIKDGAEVNANTLKAWAKRRRKEGEEIPSCITTHEQRVAKITR